MKGVIADTGSLYAAYDPSDQYHAVALKAVDLPDQAITLCDATTAAISQRSGQPVWTYDFHFDVIGVPVWRL